MFRVLIVLAATLVAPIVPLRAQDVKGLRQEYRLPLLDESFEKHPEWRLMGLAPENCVKLAPDGLRITLPTGVPKERPNTGLAIPLRINGDFEITVRYEILKEPELADSGEKATRLILIATLVEPTGSRAVFTRRLDAERGPQFSTWNSEEGKFRRHPAETMTGRLRLVRAGEQLSYWAAQPADAEFAQLCEERFSAADLIDIRLVATTGGAKAAFDVRFSDLKVRATSLPNAAAENLPAVVVPAPAPSVPIAPAAAEPATHRWLLAAAIVAGSAVVLALGAGAGFVILKRRGRRATLPDAAPAILFACPGCGRNLSVRPKLAGKNAKCKECGTVALVPAK